MKTSYRAVIFTGNNNRFTLSLPDDMVAGVHEFFGPAEDLPAVVQNVFALEFEAIRIGVPIGRNGLGLSWSIGDLRCKSNWGITAGGWGEYGHEPFLSQRAKP
jgi:hypothetical protein